MTASEIASYLSLALAVIFWVLSTKQASDAKKTLDDVKTEIITWQSQLNKAAIDMISSRPEVIAMQTSLQESKSLNDFSTQMSDIIKDLSSNSPTSEQENTYQLEVLNKLFEHHKNLILGKQQIMALVAAGRQPPQPPQQTPKPETKKQ